ncbi:hypothetical protein TanjilG_01952 [Lupinus angustifolius]|nr:hypothetical protein TanjilG_01952 [Lupinus angustifolius]
MGSTINLRNFKLCFSKSTESETTTNHTATVPSSSHDAYNNNNNPPFPTSPPLIKNFNSLYEPEPEVAADLATALASQRFFFSSPGNSNSLIEYTRQKHSSLVEGDSENKNKKKKKNKVLLFKGSVAVPTYSPDPYSDFRRSMQEMVEARPELMDVNSNWNILHQLLLSYLALNPKPTHNFILSAFSDLLISLMDVTVS